MDSTLHGIPSLLRIIGLIGWPCHAQNSRRSRPQQRLRSCGSFLLPPEGCSGSDGTRTPESTTLGFLMRLVVADTSPIFYLLSIGHIEPLPWLFVKVFVPDAVYKELCHPSDLLSSLRQSVAAATQGFAPNNDSSAPFVQVLTD